MTLAARDPSPFGVDSTATAPSNELARSLGVGNELSASLHSSCVSKESIWRGSLGSTGSIVLVFFFSGLLIGVCTGVSTSAAGA